ncbi:MAG: hypothetical protein EZS28_020864 [Streblomastix strix]|uniref:Uncharacterized protein n=1 Tax=Streblomastix strix TaxID=222440 RepID=A0A5J4VM05_9EUKA|nr:MAG: hypothetical protein EZS28_020864 [Streblomastix strix]
MSSYEEDKQNMQYLASNKGSNCILYVNKSTLQEIFRGKKQIELNVQIRATIEQPQAVLQTDAQQSSQVQSKKITSLKIKTGNNVAAYNLNGEATAISPQKLTNRIQEKLDAVKIQVHVRLFTKGPSSSRSFESTEGQTYNRHVCDQVKQENQKIHEYTSIQMCGSPGLFLGSLANRDSIPTSTNSTEPGITSEDKVRRNENASESSILVCTTLVAGTDQNEVKVYDSWQKLGRSETRRTNDEALKVSSSKKNDVLIDKGNKEKELFRRASSRRSFSELAIKKVIISWHSIWQRNRLRLRQLNNNWKIILKVKEVLLIKRNLEQVVSNFISHLDSDDASDAKQTAFRTAIGMHFKLQGVPKDKFDGLMLR